MSTFVLVHGAHHGGWAWEKVAPLLEGAGHKVLAPDLPGHGDDETPQEEVSLQGYAESLLRVLDSLEETVILVGHSMGGIAVSEAAERRPDKIEALVYLNAFLLPDGVSLLQVLQQDAESVVARKVEVDEERGVGKLAATAAQEAFYGDCSEEDAARAIARLRDEPLAPLGTPVSVTEGNFGQVPRAYVTCLRDRTVTPGAQRKMYTEMPCREVLSLETDHSPFLSRPEELARHLMSLASAPGFGGAGVGADRSAAREHHATRTEREGS